jgi:hypothetical protein
LEIDSRENGTKHNKDNPVLYGTWNKTEILSLYRTGVADELKARRIFAPQTSESLVQISLEARMKVCTFCVLRYPEQIDTLRQVGPQPKL